MYIQAGAQISTIRKLSSTLVTPILLYNSEIWGVLETKIQQKSFESFIDNMFDDSSKHESLQMKMGKIALGVHKKSPSMAVRGELGMFPLTIDIYSRIVNYLFTYQSWLEKVTQLYNQGLLKA